MGTLCSVILHRCPNTKPKEIKLTLKKSGRRNTEETKTSPCGEQGRKDGQGQASGMFVNTEGRRKRNDVFTFPLHRVAPIK